MPPCSGPLLTVNRVMTRTNDRRTACLAHCDTGKRISLLGTVQRACHGTATLPEHLPILDSHFHHMTYSRPLKCLCVLTLLNAHARRWLAASCTWPSRRSTTTASPRQPSRLRPRRTTEQQQQQQQQPYQQQQQSARCAASRRVPCIVPWPDGPGASAHASLTVVSSDRFGHAALCCVAAMAGCWRGRARPHVALGPCNDGDGASGSLGCPGHVCCGMRLGIFRVLCMREPRVQPGWGVGVWQCMGRKWNVQVNVGRRTLT